MKPFFTFLVLCLFPIITACSSGLQGEPVALPIPFSGTLTADSNILIAEGDPIGGLNIALKVSLKNQATEGFPISWELFDSGQTGLCGTMTLNSMTDPVVTPLSGGKEQRDYTLDTTLKGSDVEFEIHSVMQCIENDTPYSPTQDTLDLAATIPGATSEVKKLVCTGIMECLCPDGGDCNKETCAENTNLNLNLVTDVIVFPDGKTNFNSQRESNVTFDSSSGGGASFCVGDGDKPKGKVALTLLMQGFSFYSTPIPIPDGPAVTKQFSFSVYFPGNDDPSGIYTQHVHTESFGFDSSGNLQQFDTEATGDIILNDGSFCRIRNITYEHTHVSELDSIFDEIIKSTPLFLNDPNFDDLIFSENGGKAFHQTAGEGSGTINFDPNAQEVTGIFRDLFDQFGPYSIQSRCLALSNTTTMLPPVNLMPLVLTFAAEN